MTTPDDGMEVVEMIRSVLEAEKPPHELAQDVLTAIEASGRWKLVPVDPKSRARELWEDAVHDALSASPKTTGVRG